MTPTSGARSDSLAPLLTTEQIQKRVGELARKISQDYRGQTLHVVCVLENAFIFMADLARSIEGVHLVCQFVKSVTTQDKYQAEILYVPEIEVAGRPVLLLEALIESGITTDFLMRNLQARGASSVKICTLLDRQAARRIALQPDYYGFLLDDAFVYGYGLGDPVHGRNLPFIAVGRPPGRAAE